MDATGPDGHTPLVRAAYFERYAAALVLVDGGGAVSRLSDETKAKLAAWRGPDGETLLHVAAEEDAPRAVPFLLSLGIAVEAATTLGETALHRAAWRDGVAVPAALMGAGAKIDARRKDGDTPLIRAAAGARRSLVAFLLDEGADPDVRGAGA